MPASKVILGVPYYGRAWSTTTNKLHAKNISGEKYGTSVSVVYERCPRAAIAVAGRRYDRTEGVAWTAYRRQNCTKAYGCVTSWRQLYFDDATALKAKYDLVNGYGLRGVGLWALGYDGTRRDSDEGDRGQVRPRQGPAGHRRRLAVRRARSRRTATAATTRPRLA